MQAMSGKGSAPLARSNAPVSIFKAEGNAPLGADTVKQPKAPKTPKPATDNGTPVTPAETPQSDLSSAEPTPTAALTPAPAETEDLSSLIAANKALRERIKAAREQLKAAKASQPKGDRLSDVIARQEEKFAKWLPLNIAGKVRERVKAGQPQAEALDAVLASLRTRTEAVLAEPSAEA